MLLHNKKIAIVGGGPGGLTLAKLLQQEGAAVTVYERDTDEHARVQGSPLDLHDNSGLAAIRKAGLLEDFKNSFMAGADKMQIMDANATVIYSDHDKKVLENFGDPHFRPEIDRGVLRKLLLGSVQPETVVWNSHFTSMENHNEGWILHFKDGNTAYADLVIGADGANSKIRPYLTDITAFYSGITMLEGNIYHAATNAPDINTLLKGGKIMAFGNNKNLLMGQKADGAIGFYASLRTAENWVSSNGLDYTDNAQLLSWFQSAYPEWDKIWSQLFTSAAVFIPRPIYCIPTDQYWESKSNLTLLGDAAHVMPPFAGEGVNMAMLDALELSVCLTSGHYLSVKEALTAYEHKMRLRAAEVAKESLENGERMHAENALHTMLDFFSGHDE